MRKLDNSCQLLEKRLFSSNSNALYFLTGSANPSGIPSGMFTEPPVIGLIPAAPKQTIPNGAPVTGSSTSAGSTDEVQPEGGVPPIGKTNCWMFVAASSRELGLPIKKV